MTKRRWLAVSEPKCGPVTLGLLAFALVMLAGPALAQPANGSFYAESSLVSGDPRVFWQIMLSGFAIFALLSAIIVWVMTALRRVRMSHKRRIAFINSSLNRMSQGIVMANAQRRVVFCNDRYLEIYGIDRADLFPGITNDDLIEMRYRKGFLGGTIVDYKARVRASAKFVVELPDGRSIQIHNSRLPSGGVVSLHEDCTEQRVMGRQLATTKTFLESVVDNIPVCIAAKSIDDGRYTLANRAFEEFSRMPREKIIGRRAEDIFSPISAASINKADRAAIDGGGGNYSNEFEVERSGEKRVLASTRVVARDENGNPQFLIAMFDDVTERRHMSDELESARKFLERIVDNIPVALMVRRVNDGQYQMVNRGAETILNRSREETVGKNIVDLFGTDVAEHATRRDQEAIRKKTVVAEEQPIRTNEGLRLFSTRRVAVFDDAGAPQYIIQTHEDVTQRRQIESRMAHMAYHDALTDLPNRAAFLQSLTQMIDACEGTEEEFAVLSVDLDRLKEVNDVFGHAVGDEILIEVARRMQAVSSGGVVARLSGDEFGLIIDGKQPDAAMQLAERLGEAVRKEFDFNGKPIRLGLTIGISIYPHNGTNAATLLANADVALFRAKSKSRGSIRFFEGEMDQQIRDRRALHQDLSNAIRNGELSLHYQPQAMASRGNSGDAASNEVVGFEALARWIHPTRGFVSPADFIPLAEDSGLIVEMGEWILREACREAASWPKPLEISVNLSPAQFQHGDLVGLVHSILLETGLAPGRLELEITEGVLIEDFERGLLLLRQLKALGVKIAMDDFGSGYSSLTYLQAFPFDKIKIDRAFVMNLGRNPQSAAIVRAVIGLGHGLQITIVAEGVETSEQLEFLAQEGCDLVQGYFIGKPSRIEQYPHLVGRPAANAEAKRAG
ncbi:MAG: diguanylate cyclase [Proteobacteria bacterium SG_bin9]|nr:MAG: diguanylate cyclase [Proteobacteria bacterium SG_bin9]